MGRVAPRVRLLSLKEPCCSTGETGRSPFPIRTMVRSQFLQQWIGVASPAMGEVLIDVPLCREFAQVPNAISQTGVVLRSCRCPEGHDLATQMPAAQRSR